MYPDSVSGVHFLFPLIHRKSRFLVNSGIKLLLPHIEYFGEITQF